MIHQWNEGNIVDKLLKLLFIEDQNADYQVLVRQLRKDGLNVDCQQVKNREELLVGLASGGWDAFVSDYNVPGLLFSEIISYLQEYDPRLPVIVVSGAIGEEAAVELLKQGAHDFLLKDRPSRLASAIQNAVLVSETERRRQLAEQALQRHSRALAMLSKGNQTLLRGSNEAKLLQAMCQVAIDVGGYSMAWVGYKENDQQHTVRPIAEAGVDLGYLKQVTISWGDGELGQGPAGYSIRHGKTRVEKDLLNNPQMGPWQKQIAKWGYNSLIALPLKRNDDVFGVFILYAEQADVFDEMEVRLLEEMAEDLSFGITTLRNDALRLNGEKDLKTSYSLLKTTLESTADAIVVTSLTGDIIQFNQKFCQLWSALPSFLMSSSFEKRMAFFNNQLQNSVYFSKLATDMYANPEEVFKAEIVKKDGRVFELIGHPHYLDNDIVGRVSSMRDITEQKNHEKQLTYLATHDQLTGLPNRNLLNDRLKQAIAYAARTEQNFALLFLDLDRFKLINDSLGHNFGDQLLIEVARRIQGCLREEDTVARMGGDEFVILLLGLKSEEGVELIALKILDIIAQSYTINGRAIVLEASIGMALYPQDSNDADTLLKCADIAMYRAKEQGGNCFRYYLEDSSIAIERHQQISSQLRYAIERNQLKMYFQPQYDLKTAKITGAEALIRWNHPELGAVSPAEFISIAEESNLILKISHWVATTVFAYCSEWQLSGLPHVSVAINISARQFNNMALPDTFSKLLKKYKLNPKRFTLELEITEGMLMRDPEQAIDILHQLKAMNFDISIDDFGTGYSSLAYLKRFPIDKLKIDRAFVDDLPLDSDDAAISRAIIVMAHELGLKVVAEGVETQAQFDFLKVHQCDYIQGYLTGRPMPAEDFATLLKQQ